MPNGITRSICSVIGHGNVKELKQLTQRKIGTRKAKNLRQLRNRNQLSSRNFQRLKMKRSRKFVRTPNLHTYTQIMWARNDDSHCSGCIAEEIQSEIAVWTSESKIGERERGVTETCSSKVLFNNQPWKKKTIAFIGSMKA